jgi:squalene-hopene/tetraprenyl-beta-curcumene cyclase
MRTTLLAASFVAIAGGTLAAQDFEKPPLGSADEPMARELSYEKAARFLDNAAVTWTRARKCGTCHTNYPYLLARPLLASKGEIPPGLAEVHRFFQDRAARWATVKPAFDAEVVMTAGTLAAFDAATTGKLHPVTRQALDRLWTVQRKDGAWEWLKEDYPPLEYDDYFGAVFAAVSVGFAPDDYARGDSAREGLDRLRRYFAAEPPPNAHHEAWLLWASTRIDGLMTSERRREAVAKLLALQREDGGWSLPSFADWKGNHGKPNDPTRPSDGYATGLAVYVLRQAGLAASDERVARGVAWLRTHQRESGRWFTHSLNANKSGIHHIATAGTCFAVMALKACDPPEQEYRFTTLAGSRFGHADGKGSEAQFRAPEGIAVDRQGNLYVTEYHNSIVRKISPDGTATTLAGKPQVAGSTDGPASEALFNRPHGVAAGDDLWVYVSDMKNHTIRRISPTGVVSTVAGKAGEEGAADGVGGEARFRQPEGVAVGPDGTLYVADTYNFTVRTISKGGVVRTLAGQAGSPGDADGRGPEARFCMPMGVAVDGAGNVYVADADYDGTATGNCLVRKITPEGIVSTLAGRSGAPGGADGKGPEARFTKCVGIAVTRDGTVYVADTGAHTIRRITPDGIVSTLGGAFQKGGKSDGAGPAARFLNPQSLAVDEKGILYVADTGNHLIRKGVRGGQR